MSPSFHGSFTSPLPDARRAAMSSWTCTATGTWHEIATARRPHLIPQRGPLGGGRRPRQTIPNKLDIARLTPSSQLSTHRALAGRPSTAMPFVLSPRSALASPLRLRFSSVAAAAARGSFILRSGHRPGARRLHVALAADNDPSWCARRSARPLPPLALGLGRLIGGAEAVSLLPSAAGVRAGEW
jgi:hypothetical protein